MLSALEKETKVLPLYLEGNPMERFYQLIANGHCDIVKSTFSCLKTAGNYKIKKNQLTCIADTFSNA